MVKKNCWEVTNCGLQPDGKSTAEYGVCPASTEKSVDGIHGGKNGGRACWAVEGTLSCDGHSIQEGQKWEKCRKCAFYWNVITEEHENYASIRHIMQRLLKCPSAEVATET
jgi:hypothetical protein